MKNEYGVEVDRNGYAPSILNREYDETCYICHRYMNVQRHEVFHGSSRQKSKNYGLWINICHICHTKVHNGNGKLDNALKVDAQEKAMEYYGWTVDDFRKRFGKSYL